MYRAEIKAFTWNTVEYLNFKSGFVVGPMAGIAYGIYEAYKATADTGLIDLQQLSANQYIKDNPERELYLAQTPGHCRDGDTIAETFKNWLFQEKWLVCEEQPELATSMSEAEHKDEL